MKMWPSDAPYSFIVDPIGDGFRVAGYDRERADNGGGICFQGRL